MKNRSLLFTLIAVVLLISGCSGGSGSPVMPGNNPSQAPGLSVMGNHDTGNTFLWGYWNVKIDTKTWDIELTPLRGAQFTVDVVKFMQPPDAPVNFIKTTLVDNSEWISRGRLGLEVSITHPFPGLDQFTGADVRGVFITDGNFQFAHDSSLIMSDLGNRDAYLANADGYTRWMNPSEFPGDGTLFTYTPGIFGVPGDYSATLNGYKYFADGLETDSDLVEFFMNPDNLNNRGQFTSSMTNSRTYDLYFPMPSGHPEINFQYAVLGSWAKADEVDPDDLPGSFPPDANTQEAFLVDVTDNSTLYYTEDEAGGDILLDIEIFDWYPFVSGISTVLDEIGSVIVESPQGILPADFEQFDISSLAPTAMPGNTAASSIVTVEIPGCMPLSTAGQEVVIGILHSGDVGYDNYGAGTNYPDAPLASYFFHTLNVSDEAPHTTEPLLTAIDPDHGIPDTYLYDVVITGENLLGVTEVKLVGDTEETVAQNMAVVDDTTITCELDLSGLSLGLYDAVATDPVNGVGTLVDGFELIDCPTGIQDQFDLYTTTQSYSPLFVAGVLTSGPFTGDVVTQWGMPAWAKIDVADPPTDNTTVEYWVDKPSIDPVYNDWSWSMDMDPVNEIFAFATFDDDDPSGTWPDTSFDFIKICTQEDGSYLGAIDTNCGYTVAQVDVDEYGNVWAVCANAYYPEFGYTLQRWDYEESVPDPHYEFAGEWDLSGVIAGDAVISDIVVLQRYRRLFISHSASGTNIKVDAWDFSGDDPLWINSTDLTISGFYGTNSYQEAHQRFVDMEVDRTDSVLAGCRIAVMCMGNTGELRTLEIRKLDLDLDILASASLEFNFDYHDDVFDQDRKMWFSNFVLDDMNGGRIVATYDNFNVPPPGHIGVTNKPVDW